ncbi:MAG: hypothetical protein KJ069_04635 [Anaerolineae bacterium]|nr:hypothetical protein [Anaerolineae bacterium]
MERWWKIAIIVSIICWLAACKPPEAEVTAVPPTRTLAPTQTMTATAVPPSPTPTALPTLVPTETGTAVPLPTALTWVTQGTAFLQPTVPISISNATQLVELARWGRGEINDLALSDDGRWLAVGTETGVYIHDTEDLSKLPIHLETPVSVETVAISSDGTILVIELLGKHIQVWAVDKRQFWYDKVAYTEALKFSPNSEQIILNNSDGVHILQTVDGEIMQTYPDAVGAEFSLDNTKLSVWEKGVLFLYSWPAGVLLNQTESSLFQTVEDGEYDSRIADVHFLPENELLMSALPINPAYGETGDVLIQKASDGSVIFTAYAISPLTEPTKYVCNDPIYYWNRPPSPQPWQMELSPDGQVVAFIFRDVGYDGDVGTYTSVRFYQRETGQLLYSVEDGIVDMTISPDGKTWIAGLQDGRLQMRLLSDGAVLETVDDYDAPALKTIVSPDNELVAVEYLNGIKIFQAANGMVTHKFSANRIAFAPDGETVALGYDDGRIEIHSLRDGTLLKTIFGHSQGVTALVFLSSGELISAGLDCGLNIWQPKDGTLVKTLENYIVEGEVTGDPVPVRVWDLSYSQGNEFIVGDFAWSIGIWNIQDGSLLGVPELENHLKSSATSSQLLAIAGNPPMVGQLDMEHKFTELWRGDDVAAAVAFSPDGKLLASGAISWTINGQGDALQLLLADSGELVHEITSGTTNITGLAFAPDGRYFVSVTQDGVVRLWGIP